VSDQVSHPYEAYIL